MIQNSLLLRKVTCKETYGAKQLHEVALMTALRGNERLLNLVAENRAILDEDRQRGHKLEHFPVLVPAGTIDAVPDPAPGYPDKTRKQMRDFNGFAQLDFDYLNKVGLDPKRVRDEFAKLPFVAYSGLSVRGGGVWLLVYLDAYEMETYQIRWKACNEFCYGLLDKFVGYKVKRDTKGCNPCDYRFIAPDLEGKWRYNPQPFSISKIEKPVTVSKPSYSDSSRLVQLLDLIVAKRIDLTSSYEDWRNVGFSLAATLGEPGREWFHAISQFYPKYKQAETDKQFTESLKRSGYNFTEDLIFALARDHGIILNESKPISKPLPPKPAKPQSGVCPNTGLRWQLLPDTKHMYSDRYPADWDDLEPLPGYEKRKELFESKFLQIA